MKILRDRETDEEPPIDLEPLFAANLLTRIEPETDEEFELLVDYSALLGAGDGEAMCFALAESRGHSIAIDDERAIRRAKRRNPVFETLGTLEIMSVWQERNGISDDQMSHLLQAVFRYARFQPATSHPQYVWWLRCRTHQPKRALMWGRKIFGSDLCNQRAIR